MCVKALTSCVCEHTSLSGDGETVCIIREDYGTHFNDEYANLIEAWNGCKQTCAKFYSQPAVGPI